jgi:putative FmdB family regulatory protein
VPLYEWRCERCELTFEALAAFRVSKRRRSCPECGSASPRVMSVAALQLGRPAEPAAPRAASGRSDVTKLSVPTVARPCWMDDHAASRFAAYKHGRGAEYDDTVASSAELRRRTGTVEKPVAPKDHHGHSPLADPGVRARRAAAASRSTPTKAAR